jgi:hypothetical protein
MHMESVGEKRIQALFSELRLADEQTAPSFVGVWNRAQSETYRPQRAFNLSFVAAMALLVCALVSLALWSRQWQRNQVALVSVPPVSTGGRAQAVAGNNEGNPPAPVQKVTGSTYKSRALKLAARRQALLVAANRKATHEAKTLASWESPTATLLDSSTDQLLKSLPQLNQTVDELKSFLPSSPK